MAKKKIQKTLIVGLGGTGNLALKYAKKRFYEMYGKGESFDKFEFPLIEYLALDTDISDLKKGVGDDNMYTLKQSEYFHLKVSKPSKVLDSAPYIEREWMPKKNIEVLTAIEAGAGQIRAFGRLGLMNQYNKVNELVQQKVEILNSWRQDQNPDFEELGEGVNIVYCFSIAGGTGSGTFLDMAYLIKNCLSKKSVDFKSQAYIVLPEIFDKVIDKAMGKKRIWSNSYGALRELEFFMEGKYKKDIELLDNNKMTIPVKGAPYDLVHLISDKSSNGNDYDKISHIMELVGSSIVLKSGELNIKSNSGWDNIAKDLSMLDYLDDARTQRPRYLGLGYAEIQYNTKIVSDFVSAKFSSVLSDFIIDSNSRESEFSLEQRVLAWGIKEDEADNVIDQLLPSNSYTSFVLDGDGYDSTNSRSSIESNAESHLSSQIQNLRKKSATNLKDFQNRVINNILDDLINSDGNILDKGGIITTVDAINKLLEEPFIKRYAFQMNDEIESNYSGSGKGIKDQIKTIESRIKQELGDLTKAQDSSFFFRKGNCIPIIESLVSSYNKLLKFNAEQIKREDAKQFYAKLSTELVKLKDKLSKFKSKIEECKNDFHKISNNIEDTIGRESLRPFVIDLHKYKISNSDYSSQSSIKLSLFLDKTQKT
ncbi:MAG: tubulin-like doman-containing protein, partial [Flavobacteriales bacterium]